MEDLKITIECNFTSHLCHVGDTVEFGGLLGHAPVMKVSQFSCDQLINRKGRIPAPQLISCPTAQVQLPHLNMTGVKMN